LSASGRCAIISVCHLFVRSRRIARSGGRMAQKHQFMAEDRWAPASRAAPGLDLTMFDWIRKCLAFAVTTPLAMWRGLAASFVLLPAEEETRKSEGNYRAIFDMANDAIFVHDLETGDILDVNRKTCEMYGYTLEEARTIDVGVLSAGEAPYAQEDALQWMKKAIEEGPQIFEWLAKDKAGRLFWVEVNLKHIVIEGQDRLLVIARDITDRKQAEAERDRLMAVLERRSTQLQTAAEVSRSTSTILDTEELMDRTVNLVRERFDFYYVGLFLVDEASKYAVLRAGTGAAGRQMLEAGHKLEVGGDSMIGWCAAHGKARIALDVGQEATRFDNPLLPQTRSEMALPLMLHDQVIGALTVQSVEAAAFSQEDIIVLQAMAEQLAIAIENAGLYERIRQYTVGLERRVAERTTELAAVNKELEAFAYSVSHDLRAPLRSIDGFSQVVMEDYSDKLDAAGQDYLRRMRAASQRMGRLIGDLLKLSRVTRDEMRRERVDLTGLVQEIVKELREAQPEREVEFVVEPDVVVEGDARLLRVALENLLGNAFKFTGRHPRARIEFGVTEHEGERVYFVRDDGAGFDMTYAGKLFGAFQRLHAMSEFEGSGIGLATVQRIVHRHGGRVWAEGAVEQEATFYFTLP